jgi:hypothetical protein
MTTAKLEARLSALEAEVARLKVQRAKARATLKNRWWEKIAGTFANNAAFDSAMRSGRKWRKSEDRKSLKSKKHK